MITDEMVQEALDYLIGCPADVARARAVRVHVEKSEKSLVAELMKEHNAFSAMPISAQEREALADPRYKAHINAIKDATYDDKLHTAKRIAAEAVIEAWRTESANNRTAEKLT
jgi:hypothetical protein